jgi:hypothetical protein
VTRPDVGTTLIELIVALSIVALSAGMTTLAIRSLRPPSESRFQALLLDSRKRAIRDGYPVRIRTDTTLDSLGPRMILFLPDGSTLGGGTSARQ